MELRNIVFFLIFHGIKCNFCPSKTGLLKEDDVLDWLNALEFGNGYYESLVENEIPQKTSHYKHFKCRANCNYYQNCCNLLENYQTFNFSQINGNTFRFSYDNDSLVLKTKIVNGLWDGPLIGFQKWFLTLNMTLIANFQNGVLQGKVWKPLEENGYLISDNLQMHGKDVLYIYPGFLLGFHGEFNYGKMVSARPIRIKGYSCDQNIMVPHWEYLPENNQIYSYDQASLERLSKYPLLKDPLEEFYLEVLPSTISGAGDGVFLKRDVPKNTVVGFFNGINITLDDTFKDQDMKSSVHKMWNDWETDELLYIPKEFININAYNATFGHKINHNSDYNVDAGYITHPRFGRIRSIVTTKDLQAGQELFCKYAGTVDSTTFVRQIFKDFSNFMDLDDDGSRLTYLNEMRNDYQSMMASLNHDPDKVYRKPDLV